MADKLAYVHCIHLIDNLMSIESYTHVRVVCSVWGWMKKRGEKSLEGKGRGEEGVRGGERGGEERRGEGRRGMETERRGKKGRERGREREVGMEGEILGVISTFYETSISPTPTCHHVIQNSEYVV